MADSIRYSRINVRHYGAVGDDVADDTAAFREVFRIAAKTGQTIYLPQPKVAYRITSNIYPKPYHSPSANRDGAISIEGDGMYTTVIHWTGTGYCFDYLYHADKLTDPADYDQRRGYGFDALTFKRFQIDTDTGGGIRLPQGGQIYFDEYYQNGAGPNDWGIYMPGNPYDQYGIYMIEISRSRFWRDEAKGGYLGRVIYVQDFHTFVLRDTFVSQQRYNGTLIEISNGKNAQISNTALEGFNNLGVSPTNMTMVELTGYVMDVSFRNLYLEGNWNTGVRMSGGAAANVKFDVYFAWCYGSNTAQMIDAGPNNGNDNVSADNLTFKSDTDLDSTTYIINDPYKVVTLNKFVNKSSRSIGTQRPVTQPGSSGTAGVNQLVNPGLYSGVQTAQPFGVDTISGTYTFNQVANGCNVKQTSGNSIDPYRFRFYTVEPMDKHDAYTFFIIGVKRGGVTPEFFIAPSGGDNIGGFKPGAIGDRFAASVKVARQTGPNNNIIDMTAYDTWDMDIIAAYLIPNDTTAVPYGAENGSFSKLNLGGGQITYGSGPLTAGIANPGDIVLNDTPGQGGYIGWACTAYGKAHKPSTCSVTAGSTTVTSVTNIDTWAVGDRIKGLGVNGLATITAINTGAHTMTLNVACNESYELADIMGEATFMPIATVEVEGQSREAYQDTSAPTTGSWKQGDRVWYRYPSTGGYLGTVCTAGGRFDNASTDATGTIAVGGNVLTVNHHRPFRKYDRILIGADTTPYTITGYDFGGTAGAPRFTLDKNSGVNATNAAISYAPPIFTEFSYIGQSQRKEAFFDTAPPTWGNWNQSDIAWYRYPSPGGYIGAVCVTTGKYDGATTTCTGTVTAGGNILTVNHHAPFQLWEYIVIGTEGVPTQITQIDFLGTAGAPRFVLNRNVPAAWTNAAISYAPPVFKGFGAIQA